MNCLKPYWTQDLALSSQHHSPFLFPSINGGVSWKPMKITWCPVAISSPLKRCLWGKRGLLTLRLWELRKRQAPPVGRSSGDVALVAWFPCWGGPAVFESPKLLTVTPRSSLAHRTRLGWNHSLVCCLVPYLGWTDSNLRFPRKNHTTAEK